jgi:Zn-dependent protease with chaperone function
VDFFARQEQARRTTRHLIVLFTLAFLAVAVLTAVAATAAFSMYGQYDPIAFGGRSVPQWLLANVAPLSIAAASTFGAMVLASAFRTASLAGGGGQVARMLGGTEIAGNETDLLRQRLINVVEEMAIASGLPVPTVFVLEQEPAINAFAAGLTYSDAALAVTRGSLERLDRAELQGVIAHEFGHILNGDMRLNQRLIGFSFGILVLWLMGRWLLRSTRFAHTSRGRGTSAAAMIGIAMLVIGGIGVLLSRLIKAAVARERESLADASAVQFTRDPSGLAGALKKIGGFTTYLNSVETEEVAHMLFGRGAPSFRGLFATHPPLIDRIRSLDPSFDPADYPAADSPLPAQTVGAEERPGGLHAQFAAPTLDAVGRVGEPEIGAALREAMPEELYHAAHGRESSLLLVLAFALSSDPTTQARQRALLDQKLGAQRAQYCVRLRREIATADRRLWLPLLSLAAPALKARPTAQMRFLFETAEALTAVDDELDLFEYALLRMLVSFMRATGHALPLSTRRSGLHPDEALAVMLATVACHGHTSAADAQAAYAAGLAAIGRSAESPSRAVQAALEHGALADLDAALDVLGALDEAPRRAALTALLATIRHDRTVELAEIELFRAIAAVLGCPMPAAQTIR